MLVQNITIPAGELNSGIVIVKDITDKNVVVRSGLIDFPTSTNFYAVTKMRVKNSSGATVNYLPITSFEDTSYTALGSVLTDFLSIENDTSVSFDSFRGRLSNLIVQGTATHASGIVFNFIQE